MKYLSLVLFIFCLHISMSAINAVGFLHSNQQPLTNWFEQVDDSSLANASYVQGTVNTDSFGFGDFVKALFYFVLAFGFGIIAVPYTLAGFGLQAPFIYYFSLPIYILYLLAIAQFIGNRGTRGMS